MSFADGLVVATGLIVSTYLSVTAQLPGRSMLAFVVVGTYFTSAVGFGLTAGYAGRDDPYPALALVLFTVACATNTRRSNGAILILPAAAYLCAFALLLTGRAPAGNATFVAGCVAWAIIGLALYLTRINHKERSDHLE